MKNTILLTPEQIGIIENCLNSAKGKIYTSEYQMNQIELIKAQLAS